MPVDEADGLGRSPLWWACACGHETAAAALLDCGATAVPRAPIERLSRETLREWVRTTGDAHADTWQLPGTFGVMCAVGTSPLAAAVAAGHEGVVVMLLDRIHQLAARRVDDADGDARTDEQAESIWKIAGTAATGVERDVRGGIERGE